MLKIDEQALQCSAAPSVYVRTIKILEASVPQVKTNNTTDNSRKPSKTKNAIDGTIGYEPPPIKIQDNDSVNGLRVLLDLAIAAVNSGTEKGLNWIDNEDVRKTLLVKIVQSTNKELSTRLTTEEGAKFFDENDTGIFQGYNKFIDYQIKQVSLASQQNQKSKVTEKINSLTSNKILNLVERIEFDIPMQPTHLNYFVLCQVGETSIASPLIPHSPIIIEKVIENSELVERAFRFVNADDGAVWAGSAHDHPERGWMQGAFHTDEPHKSLVRQTVDNVKVSYMPDVNRLTDVQINISNDLSDERINYFSNLYLTRDKFGNAIFGFNFDHLNFMINNSKFGGLFLNSTPDLVRSLIASSPIIDLTIKRERIHIRRAANRLESEADLVTDFITNLRTEQDEQTVISTYDTSGILKSNTKYSFNGAQSHLNSRQVYAGDEIPPDFSPSATIREVSLGNLTGFRMFTGQDLSISSVSDGMYQYSVSLQIRDGTSELLQNRLNEYLLSIRDVEEYLSRASFSKNYDQRTNKFTEAFISSELNTTLGQGWFVAIMKYIETLDLLTDISEKDKLSLTSALYSLVNPVVATPDTITEFLNIMNSLESKLKKILSKESARHTREKSSISTGGSYPIFEISQGFQDVFDSNIIKNSGIDYLGIQGTSGMASMTRDGFISRLDTEYNRVDGIKYTVPEIQTRFNFLTPENVTSLFSDKTKGSDMAPSFVELNGERVNLLPQNIDSLDYVSITAILQNILFNNAGGSRFIGASKQILNLLNDVGKGSDEDRVVKIKNLQQQTSQVLGLTIENNGGQSGQASSTISSDGYVGASNKFTSGAPVEESISVRVEDVEPENATSLVNRVLQILNVNSNSTVTERNRTQNAISFDLSKENNFISKNIIPSNQRDDIAVTQARINNFLTNDLPHQQKLLTLRKARLYSDAAAVASSDDDTEVDAFMYNFGMLRRVEYLSGFNGGSIKSEIWKKLTFQNLSSLNGTIFCRIRKYNQTSLNIGDYGLLDSLPVYNEYFFIVGEQTVTQQQNQFEQQAVYDKLLRLVSMSAYTSEEIQYLVTQIPQAPTSAFKKMAGVGVKTPTRNGDGTPKTSSNNTTTTASTPRTTGGAVRTTVTSGMGGVGSGGGGY
jgi:hypothetical protein|tara:strand:- start:2105 stop:5491 length:3387 start_codon:yes stop_codon:yes gene_type:complete